MKPQGRDKSTDSDFPPSRQKTSKALLATSQGQLIKGVKITFTSNYGNPFIDKPFDQYPAERKFSDCASLEGKTDKPKRKVLPVDHLKDY
jgi:hypothetical protein